MIRHNLRIWRLCVKHNGNKLAKLAKIISWKWEGKKNCSFPFFERLHSSKICKCNSKTAWIFFWTQGCSADVTIKSNVAQAAHLIESFFTHQETYKSSSQFETLCKKVIGYILCNNDKDATIFCPSRKSTKAIMKLFGFRVICSISIHSLTDVANFLYNKKIKR